MNPVINDATAANRNTLQSSDISFSRGVSAGSNRTKPCRLAAAASKPAIPASAPTNTLSDNNCCINRPEEAPSAPRTAISRSRPAARASIRLATLAQAISRIKTTAPNSSSRRGRVAPTSDSSSGTTVRSEAQVSGIRQGNSGNKAACSRCNSACACAGVTPSFSRPNIRRSKLLQGSIGSPPLNATGVTNWVSA